MIDLDDRKLSKLLRQRDKSGLSETYNIRDSLTTEIPRFLSQVFDWDPEWLQVRVLHNLFKKYSTQIYFYQSLGLTEKFGNIAPDYQREEHQQNKIALFIARRILQNYYTALNPSDMG